jgi:hypothetical protein
MQKRYFRRLSLKHHDSDIYSTLCDLELKEVGNP